MNERLHYHVDKLTFTSTHPHSNRVQASPGGVSTLTSTQALWSKTSFHVKASPSKPTHTSSERASKPIQTQGSWSYRSEFLHSHQTRPHRADLPHPHQPKPHQVEPLLPMILIRPGLICLSLFIHKARPCWAVFRSYDAGGCCSPDAGIENSRSRQFRFIMSRWDRSTNQLSPPEIVIGKRSRPLRVTDGPRGCGGFPWPRRGEIHGRHHSHGNFLCLSFSLILVTFLLVSSSLPLYATQNPLFTYRDEFLFYFPAASDNLCVSTLWFTYSEAENPGP